MTVGGKEFFSDLIIHPDGRVQEDWWRAQGHRLLPEDIAAVLEAAPEKLVIGTGAGGLMAVSEEVLALCEERGIAVEARPTAEAVTRFNEAAHAGETVAACFHLTC
jgi:hypothetical protein